MTAGFARLVVRVIALLVPRSMRARWREEWLGEIQARLALSKAGGRFGVPGSGLLRRVAGAPRDALACRLAIRTRAPRRRSGPRLASDLRSAWRALSARPGSSMALVLVIALGVGLTTAMFALTDPYLLRPLPYADPDALVRLTWDTGNMSRVDAGDELPSIGEWQAREDLFIDVAALGDQTERGLVEPAAGTLFQTREVSRNFLDVLGVPGPSAADWTQSDQSVVLTPAGLPIGDAPRHAGQIVRLDDGSQLRVIDELPDGFIMPSARRRAGGLVPFEPDALRTVSFNRTTNIGELIARLQPGITAEQVERALSKPLASGATFVVHAEFVRDFLTRDVRPLAYGAVSAAALILLACAGSVANIFLTRWTHRTAEFQTRTALGASAADIWRLWSLDLAMLGIAGFSVGLAIAVASVASGAHLVPAAYVTLGAPVIAWRSATFAAAATAALAGIGAVPMILRRRVSARSAGGGRWSSRLRIATIAAEASFAVILAVGAAMLVQSYANLLARDTGYAGTAMVIRLRSLTSPIPQPVVVPPNTSSSEFFYGGRIALDASLDALRRLPRVLEVAAASGSVVTDMISKGAVTVNGETSLPNLSAVTANYFDTVGTPVLRGRALTAADRDWRATVVNEAFVRQHWPGREPLGAVISRGSRQVEVVGVVRDALTQGLDEPAEPTAFHLLSESAARSLALIARVDGDPADLREPIRRTLARLNPGASIGAIDTIDGRLAESIRDRTFATLVLTFFGTAAVSVTVVGLAGLVAFVVARRSREIAIRMAIGAQPGHIRRLLIHETATAAVAGGVAGLLVGRWSSTWLESFVYGVEAGNWTTAVGALAVVMALMLAAAVLPAQRALRIDPTVAMRLE